MIPLEVQNWYERNGAIFEKVKKRAEETVRMYCDSNGFAYTGRPKDSQSVAEKLETGRVTSLLELDDRFACSIIIPNLNHEAGVIAWLNEHFTQHAIKERYKTKKEPDVFRFQATRFIGRLRLNEADHLVMGSILFEVQIRTAFEHAWSVATHSPAYKSGKIDWRLERLSAQMKALVEQLDTMAVAYDQSSENIATHPCLRVDSEARILRNFLHLKTENWIPEECEPSKWSLFAKNVYSLIQNAKWANRREVDERVDEINARVMTELHRIGRGQFPRSISLFQFVLGVLVQGDVISPVFGDKYHPPVSAALEDIYPKSREITPRCDLRFENESSVGDEFAVTLPATQN